MFKYTNLTAADLSERCLEHSNIEGSNPPRVLTDIRQEFHHVVMTSCTTTDENVLFAENDFDRLIKTMTDCYANETAFGKALFETLRGCLTQFEIECNDTKNSILLRSLNDADRYAVGFALDCLPKSNKERTASNHAVCLFQRENHKWNAKECFGVIAIETSETNCEAFSINEHGAVLFVKLESSSYALGQTILHTMRSVVPFHARNGILEPSIPLAVIAAKKKTQATKRRKLPERLRWVSGSLNTPAACGDRFTFSVDSFGRFYEDVSDDRNSAEEAVRLFLDALLGGLKVAIRVRDRRNGGTTVPPVSACGRFVYDVLQQEGLAKIDFGNRRDDAGEETVLVKVSSTAIHHLLINPNDAFMALYFVKQGQKAMVDELRSVLHAAVLTDVGLVTIMSDLSAAYGALKPSEAKAGGFLPLLWTGFKTLVENVLLPLAKKDIIYPVIQPGYDITTSILCSIDGVGPNRKATMKLIDFESLVQVGKWIVQHNGAYLSRRPEWNATTYVWWQCVFIAYVWSKKINAGDVGKGGKLWTRILLTVQTDWPESLVARLCSHAVQVKMDESVVKSTLADLGTLFHE